MLTGKAKISGWAVTRAGEGTIREGEGTIKVGQEF